MVAREAPAAGLDTIARVHDRAYVDRVLAAVPAEGYARLDPDTALSPGSGEAALRAAGAAAAAVDAVIAGEARRAFLAVRPPGHHAEPSRAMGFCLFNNAAVAALHARVAHGIERVAVVDFDVHHGNGTEAVARGDPALFFASSHQVPLYPGTGADPASDPANIVNAPLAPYSDGTTFRAAWAERILPALAAFAPGFVVISAGFDAHAADPLANLMLTEDDFAWVTAEICSVAEHCAAGRVVSTLEGGYNLEALAASTLAHVTALAAA
jgi:acetoin utilization deacetylase AcuC-like enzyme